MCEERKDANAKLTDEAVAEATGGSLYDEIQKGNQIPEPMLYTCPNCQFVYVSRRSIRTGPSPCPNCGYTSEPNTGLL